MPDVLPSSIGDAVITMESPPGLLGALCAGREPWWDYEIDGECRQDRDDRHAVAIRVCERCPVIEECREWGARMPRARYGVWGGRLHIERPRRTAGTGPERSATARTRPTAGERTPNTATAA